MAEQDHWLVRPATIRKLWIGFIVVLVLTVAAQFFIELHPHFEAEGWFGFYAGYGFIVCVAMVVGAKVLGMVLKRKETYYDHD